MIRTKVKTSNIEGAGNGRFADEGIKAGNSILVGDLLGIADAKVSIAQDPSSGIVFHVTSESDLNELEEFLVHTCDKATTENVRVGMSHFLAAGPKQSDGKAPPNFLMWQSTHINHSQDKFNGKFVFIGNQFHCLATRDIAAGEELFNDYSTFVYLPCTEQWVEKYNLTTPQKTALYYEALAKKKATNEK